MRETMYAYVKSFTQHVNHCNKPVYVEEVFEV